MSTALSQPTRPFLRELALHALAWLVCAAGLFHVYDLRHADPKVPIALDSWGDGVYYGAQVKIMLETGWVYHHPDLGAPFGLYLYDFAHFDALHLFIMKLIGYAWPHWAVILNVFFLLTFGLSASTSLALLRHLRFSAVLALPFALVFAFQPYHFDRGQGHIMLAAYYHVPLMAFGLVWLLQPAGLRDAEGVSLWKSWRFRLSILFAFLGIFGGIYYAFFFCLFYLVAGVYSASRLRRWAPMIQAALLIGVVGLGFVCNLIPNALYWSREGSNRPVSAKSPIAVEQCSLRLTPLLLPQRHHLLEHVRLCTEFYERHSAYKQLEAQSAIGLGASIGLVALIGLGLFGERRDEENAMILGLGVVVLVGLLVATMSGFGALFAFLVNPQIHAYGRMAPCLALFGLIASGYFLDGWRPRGRPVWGSIALAALGTLTLLDVVPTKPATAPEAVRTQFEAIEQFARTIQGAVPEGTAIYTLPSSRFPLERYDYLSLYLFTKNLRWSGPAMMNRRAAVWHEEIERLPPGTFLEQVVLMGFEGLVLDSRLQKTPLAEAVARHLAEIGLTPLASEVGCAFYDLRPLADDARAGLDPEQWNQKRYLASQPVYARGWVAFLPQEADGGRWGVSRKGSLEIVNTEDAPVEVELSFRARASGTGLDITSSVLSEGTVHVEEGGVFSRHVTLLPGQNRLTFHNKSKSPRIESPNRWLWFRVEQFSLHLASDPTPVAHRRRP